MKTHDGMDHEDWRLLLSKVVIQCFEDYIKLQHPKRRDKHHIAEAYKTSAVMLFDKNYIAENLVDIDGNKMDLKSILCESVGTERVDLVFFRNKIIDQTFKYWRKKEVYEIKIPDSVIIGHHTYRVLDLNLIHFDEEFAGKYDKKETEIKNFFIDHDSQIIFLDMSKSKKKLSEMLVLSILLVMLNISKVSLEDVEIVELSKVLHSVFAMNFSLFTEV